MRASSGRVAPARLRMLSNQPLVLVRIGTRPIAVVRKVPLPSLRRVEMLNPGRMMGRHCQEQGVSRRELLQVGACSALGLTLPQLWAGRVAAAGQAARVQSVLLLWLWGGPRKPAVSSPITTSTARPIKPPRATGWEPIISSCRGRGSSATRTGGQPVAPLL